ncbi:MAG: PilN domain-containing protein, partial [Bdellovibrio sp.]
TSIAADMGDSIGQQDLQKQGLFRLLLLLLGPLALIGMERMIIPQKTSQLRRSQAQLAELEAKNIAAKSALGETKKFKDLEAKIQNQIQTIEGLRKKRLNEVKLLSAIQEEIPEKLWLSKLEIRSDQLILQGTSATDAEMTSFMDNLSKQSLISSVDLIKSSEGQISNVIVKKFEIRCGIRLDAPEGVGK